MGSNPIGLTKKHKRIRYLQIKIGLGSSAALRVRAVSAVFAGICNPSTRIRCMVVDTCSVSDILAPLGERYRDTAEKAK